MTDPTNTTDDEMERWLREVPLRRPPLSVDRRVHEVLAARPRWPRLAVAAAVLLVAGGGAVVAVWHPHGPPGAVAVTSRPAGGAATVAMMTPIAPTVVERAVSREVSDGVVAVTDNVPYERVRRQTVRETWYLDPRTGSRVKVSEPVEEVVMRPVEAY